MSQRIAITLPDEVAGPLSEVARTRHQTLEEFGSESLTKSVLRPREGDAASVAQAETRFARWIGSVSLGHPSGSDNESVDADVAGEYASTNENGD
jgi:hypothetical protein